jgi:REP element-mobilizing transposase RayT
MCTQDSLCYLGEVIGDEFRPSQVGELAIKSWEWLPGKYPYVELDAWVLMPNHFHGILVICDEASSSIRRGGSRAAPTTPRRKPLGQLIGAFKTMSTKEVNRVGGSPGARLWQRGFYEHVIKNERDLARIREYIINNPAQWSLDRENPDRLQTV